MVSDFSHVCLPKMVSKNIKTCYCYRLCPASSVRKRICTALKFCKFSAVVHQPEMGSAHTLCALEFNNLQENMKSQADFCAIIACRLSVGTISRG